MQLTVNIPDAVSSRVVDAVAARGGYKPFLLDGITPNPQTKAQFAKQRVIEWLKGQVTSYEADLGNAAVVASVEADIVLT